MTPTVDGYSVQLFTPDIYGGVPTIDCGVDFGPTLQSPDPAAPHAAFLEAMVIDDYVTFAEMLAAWEEASVINANVPVIGGEIGGFCVDEDPAQCLMMWHRDGLVIQLGLAGPAAQVGQDATVQLLTEMIPAVIESLSAYGASAASSVTSTTAPASTGPASTVTSTAAAASTGPASTVTSTTAAASTGPASTVTSTTATTETTATPPSPGATAPSLGTIVIVSINGSTTIVEAVRDGSTVEAVAQLDGSLISSMFVNGAVWVGLFDRVAIIDVATGAVQEVPIPGASSGLLMFGDEQAVWASGFGPLARIDPTTRAIIGQYDLAAAPFPAGAIAVGAAAGDFFFVDASGTNLSRFNGDVVTPVGVLPFAFSAGDQSAVNNGTLYVGDIETGLVALIDTATNAITTVEITRPLLFNDEVQELGRPVTFATTDNGVIVTFGPATAMAGTAPDAPVNGFAIAQIEPDGTVTPEERFAPEATVVAAASGYVVIQTLVDLSIIESETNQATLLTPSGALVDSVYILSD